MSSQSECSYYCECGEKAPSPREDKCGAEQAGEWRRARNCCTVPMRSHRVSLGGCQTTSVWTDLVLERVVGKRKCRGGGCKSPDLYEPLARRIRLATVMHTTFQQYLSTRIRSGAWPGSRATCGPKLGAEGNTLALVEPHGGRRAATCDALATDTSSLEVKCEVNVVLQVSE